MKILIFLISLSINYLNNSNKAEIYQEILKQEILFPEICWQQAGAETSWGTTGVGKTKNNLFGFRNKSGYLNFDSFESSISYYKNWQTKNYPNHLKVAHSNSKCDYYHYLNSIGYKTGKPYSEKEKDYTNYLKRIKL